MATTINLKDKKRSWALFPPPTKEEEIKKKENPFPSGRRVPAGAELPQKTEIAWETPEYIYYPKSPDWYWAVGIISLALILIAIFTGNLFFAIFAAVAGFTIALWGARKPKIVTIRLDGNGMRVNERLYSYQELVSFWIHYHPPFVKEISFTAKSAFLPYVRVPIGNENPAEVRAFLMRFLPEKIQEDSLIDIVARALKF